MTANNNELLSALVDGELTGQELDKAIELVSTDSEARAQFQRYQRTSNMLHGHGTTSWQTEISQQIKTALSDEPQHVKPTIQATAPDITIPNSPNPEPASNDSNVLPFPGQFWKQATGLAIAASFGALAVITTTTQPDLQTIPAAPMTIAETAPSQPVQVQTASVATVTSEPGHRWTVEEQEIEDRLNVYLLDHNEYAGASDIFSNARVIAYDAGQ